MQLVGMTKSRNSLLAGVAMTAMERRAGRFLRAPDHGAGTGGGDAGAGDGASAAGEVDAGAQAGAEGAAGDAAAGGADGQSAAAGGDAGDDDATALGGAAKKDGESEGGADDGGKKDGDGAAEHVVPEAYELTAPEGMTIDTDLLEEATPIFKEAGLSNDQANAILPVAKSLMEKTQNATVQSMIDAGNQQRKAWLDEAKADAEIGGNKWDASLHSAAKALDALGHPEGSPFRTALNETGFGNHPEFIRIFAGLGERIGEDGDFVRADAGAKVEETREQRWYGNKE